MEYTKQDKIILWLYLSLGSGFNKLMGLMDYYGDLNCVWDNFDKDDDNLVFLSAKTKSTLAKTKDIGYLNNCIEKWKNPKFTTVLDNKYPKLLKETINPPLLLFYDGDLNGIDRCIGIVGSRNCTKYGLDCAKEISYDLAAEGVCVVSGGARGIDTRAHEGALDAGGKTVCVFGCGLNIAYPPENERLFYNIIEKGGAIITEFKYGEEPRPWNFPFRNRIISGMCSGVAVIEASEKSGALITAEEAANENREVFCVPGNINSAASKGTNALIKDGATLLDSYKDIMFACGWSVAEKTKKTGETKKTIDILRNLNDTERVVADIIVKNGSISADALCDELNMSIAELNSILTMMEIDGVIKRLPGNLLAI